MVYAIFPMNAEKYVKEMQSKHKFSITGILLDEGENMSFSLEKFAKKIYRTSDFAKMILQLYYEKQKIRTEKF